MIDVQQEWRGTSIEVNRLSKGYPFQVLKSLFKSIQFLLSLFVLVGSRQNILVETIPFCSLNLVSAVGRDLDGRTDHICRGDQVKMNSFFGLYDLVDLLDFSTNEKQSTKTFCFKKDRGQLKKLLL